MRSLDTITKVQPTRIPISNRRQPIYININFDRLIFIECLFHAVMKLTQQIPSLNATVISISAAQRSIFECIWLKCLSSEMLLIWRIKSAQNMVKQRLSGAPRTPDAIGHDYDYWFSRENAMHSHRALNTSCLRMDIDMDMDMRMRFFFSHRTETKMSRKNI